MLQWWKTLPLQNIFVASATILGRHLKTSTLTLQTCTPTCWDQMLLSSQTLNGNQPSKKNPQKTLENLKQLLNILWIPSTVTSATKLEPRQMTSKLTLKSHTVTCFNHFQRSQQQDPKWERLLHPPRDPVKTRNQKEKDKKVKCETSHETKAAKYYNYNQEWSDDDNSSHFYDDLQKTITHLH